MVAKFKRFKKASYQTLFFSTLLGVLVLIVIGFLVISNWKISQKRAILYSQIEALRKEIQVLEEKKQQLEAQISNLTEKDYLEKEARERFNLKKPGEKVVTILPEENKGSSFQKKRSWWNFLDWLVRE